MRITGGRLRGRVLRGRVQAGVRPTSSRVREALFSMVGQQLDGWSALDGFGGSGLLAFEAWSRGADPVTVVERRARVAAAIRAEASQLGATVQVRQADLARVLPEGQWDLVLLDPPYDEAPEPWLERAAPAVGRLLVFEHRSAVTLPDTVGALVLVRSRVYGDTSLSLYAPAAPPPEVPPPGAGG